MIERHVSTRRVAGKKSLLPNFLEFEGHEFDVVVKRRMGATRHRLEDLFDDKDKIDAHLKSMLWRIGKLSEEGGEERKVLRWIGFYAGAQEARGTNVPTDLVKFKEKAKEYKPKGLSRTQMDNYKHQALEYVELCEKRLQEILKTKPTPELKQEKVVLSKIRNIAEKIPGLIDAHSTSEVMSSIGFCQGLLVGSGKFTIMDVRGHNRRKESNGTRLPGDPHPIRGHNRKMASGEDRLPGDPHTIRHRK